jgi:hypothetical protein
MLGLALIIGGAAKLTACTGGPMSLTTGSSEAISTYDQALSCRDITAIIGRHTTRLRATPVNLRAQAELPPQTAVDVVARLTAPPGTGLPALRDYNETRARLVRLNARLVELKCAPVDLDRELGPVDAALASGRWRFGTPAEARTLLDLAMAELKKDRAAALRKFLDAQDAWGRHDLRVDCADAESGDILTAAASAPQRIHDLRDTQGHTYGSEILRAATEGKVAEVRFEAVMPDNDKVRATRIALATRHARTVCWVSHLK